RQVHLEYGSNAFFAVNAYLSSHAFANGFDDAQPQPTTEMHTRIRAFRLFEIVENALDIAFRYALASIFHNHVQLGFFCIDNGTDVECNLSSVGEFDGVAQ